MGYYDNRQAPRVHLHFRWKEILKFSNGLFNQIWEFAFTFLKLLLYFAEPLGFFFLLVAFAMNFGYIEHLKGWQSDLKEAQIIAKLESIEHQLQALNTRLDNQQNLGSQTLPNESNSSTPGPKTSDTVKKADQVSDLIEITRSIYWTLYTIGSALILLGSGFERLRVYKKTAENRLYDNEKVDGKNHKLLRYLYIISFISFIGIGYFFVSAVYAIPIIKGIDSDVAYYNELIIFCSSVWAVSFFIYRILKKKKGIDGDVI